MGAQSLENFTWVRASSQPRNNGQAQGIVFEGRLYSFGGYAPCCTPSEKVYSFDPKQDVWKRLNDMPVPVVKAGIATDGEYIYIVGGYGRRPGGGQIYGTSAVWRYSPATDQYFRLGNLPQPNSTGQLAYVNGELHYIGGTTAGTRAQDLDTHWVLNLSIDQWESEAPLPNPRHHAAAVTIGTMIYYIGGQKGHDDNLIPQNAVHRYDTSTNTWQEMAPMPGVGRNHISHSTVVINGKIVVFGGQTYENQVVDSVLEYNPATNSWRELGKLFAPRGSGIAGVIDGVAYYATGDSAATYKGYYQPIASKIENFTLIDTAKDYPISVIQNGSTVDLDAQPSALSIGIVFSGWPVRSVVMGWNGNPRYRVENSAPFAYFDNSATNYVSGPIPLGLNTLTATPYSGPNGTGTPGTPLTIQFNVVRGLNHAPQIANPGDQLNVVGQPITPLQVIASDPDNDTITYLVENLPLGLTLDPTTGLITGTPDPGWDIPLTITYEVSIYAKDSRVPPLFARTDFLWRIHPTDLKVVSAGLYDPQVYGWLGNEIFGTLNLGDLPPVQKINYAAAISYPDDLVDRVEFDYVYNGVPGLRVDETEPYTLFDSDSSDVMQPGTLTVTITPYHLDGQPGQPATYSYTIIKNDRPRVRHLVDQFHNINEPITPVQLNFTDPDGDPLTYTATGLPPGITLSSTGLLTGTPTQLGTYLVELRVEDPYGEPFGHALEDFYWVIIPTENIAVTELWLINTVTDQPIMQLTDGMTVNLYPYDGFTSIEAITTGPVGSVGFNVENGSQYNSYYDNTAPFSMFRSVGNDYWPGVAGFNLPSIITAIPFYGPNRTAGAGPALTVSVRFTYDNGCTPEAQSNYECDFAYPWNMPYITQIGDTFSYVNEFVSLQILADDYDLLGDVHTDMLRYMAIGLPDGITIDPVTGVISGTATSVGVYPFTLIVIDAKGYSDWADINWIVDERPEGSAVQAPAEITPVATVEATPEATPEVPAEVTPEPTSEVTPEPTTEPNLPPVMEFIGDEGGSVNVFVSFAPVATDPDSDTLTFSAVGLPAGTSIDAATGLMSGSPMTAGLYTVTVTVTDDGTPPLSASATFTWTVSPAPNEPPTLDSVPDQSSVEGDSVSLSLIAGDPEGGPVQVTASGLPAGLAVDLSGAITGTVEAGSAASSPYSVTVTVTDGEGLTNGTSFNWVVTAP